MTWTSQLFPLLVAAVAVSFLPAAAASNTTTSSLQSLLAEVSQWRETHLGDPSSHPGDGAAHAGVRPNTVVAWALSFLAASVSSAGGVGGGSLFLPILNLVAGLSLKRATAYSSFMVTGGAASNVLYNLASSTGGGGRLINYDIALLFQPCLLLGVSIGVVCNVVFPEWLVTLLFSLFLAFCTAKTCCAGVKIWRSESGGAGAGAGAARGNQHHGKEPLLLRLPRGTSDFDAEGGGGGNGAGFPWADVALLVMVWLCFFALHVLIGDKHGKTPSATTMFTILLASLMSTAQSITLGVKGAANALVYATICFVVYVVGLAAIRKSGRASLIVLAVAAIMALSAAVSP